MGKLRKLVSLAYSLTEFKDYADPLKLLKIEKYINELCDPFLNSDEKGALDSFMAGTLDSSVLANYFLAYIDFKIELQGSNQLKLDRNSFVVLKDKFLNILSRIDSNDVRVSLIGLLIHVASRIYFELKDDPHKKNELVSLIEHLDCPIFKEFKIWEIYFIHRVNKNPVLYNVQNKSHCLVSLDSNEKIIKLADPLFRGVVKMLKEGENLYNVALKEIAYYLIMLKNSSENSTEILLKIYVKYSIEKTLMEGIMSIHKSCAGAFIQNRINDLVLKDKRARRVSSSMATQLSQDQDQSSPYRLELVFSRTLPYLDQADKPKLLYLNGSLSRRLKPHLQEHFLAMPDLTQAQKAVIYKSAVPTRFLVS